MQVLMLVSLACLACVGHARRNQPAFSDLQGIRKGRYSMHNMQALRAVIEQKRRSLREKEMEAAFQIGQVDAKSLITDFMSLNAAAAKKVAAEPPAPPAKPPLHVKAFQDSPTFGIGTFIGYSIGVGVQKLVEAKGGQAMAWAAGSIVAVEQMLTASGLLGELVKDTFLKKLDLDGDGKLDKGDLEMALDLNKDGKVDAKDWALATTRIMKLAGGHTSAAVLGVIAGLLMGLKPYVQEAIKLLQAYLSSP